MNKFRGFTLLEVMVVLVIMALILVVVPPFLPNVMASTHVKSAARELAASLKTARSQAIDHQSETTLVVNVDEESYMLTEGSDNLNSNNQTYKNLVLPDAADLSLITAESEKLSEHEGQIRFFPDGSSTGGQIKLAFKDQEYLINVHWLTGRVRITP
jgi:general secretion pathway protein H